MGGDTQGSEPPAAHPQPRARRDWQPPAARTAWPFATFCPLLLSAAAVAAMLLAYTILSTLSPPAAAGADATTSTATASILAVAHPKTQRAAFCPLLATKRKRRVHLLAPPPAANIDVLARI